VHLVPALVVDRLPAKLWRPGNVHAGARLHFCVEETRTIEWNGRVVGRGRKLADVMQGESACPMCESASFIGGKCERCGRPLIQDRDYVDDIEMLAKDVVDEAVDFFDDLRGTASNGPELQRAIVRLADRLRQYHWDGDGCLEATTNEDPR
jgi:hypothetical protein